MCGNRGASFKNCTCRQERQCSPALPQDTRLCTRRPGASNKGLQRLPSTAFSRAHPSSRSSNAPYLQFPARATVLLRGEPVPARALLTQHVPDPAVSITRSGKPRVKPGTGSYSTPVPREPKPPESRNPVFLIPRPLLSAHGPGQGRCPRAMPAAGASGRRHRLHKVRGRGRRSSASRRASRGTRVSERRLHPEPPVPPLPCSAARALGAGTGVLGHRGHTPGAQGRGPGATLSRPDRRRGKEESSKAACSGRSEETPGREREDREDRESSGPRDPRHIKGGGGGEREGQHGGSPSAGAAGALSGGQGLGGCGGFGPGPLGPLTARPKAAASRPAPPGQALPPRLPARPPVRTPPGEPLTRPARPTLPMGRGGAPGPRRRGQGGLGALGVSPRPQDPNRRQPLRRVRRARGGAASRSACGRERGAPAPAPRAAPPRAPCRPEDRSAPPLRRLPSLPP
ncbi:LOW QUALITY PROTEIN: spidroin-2-like [Mustela erminea]|uniref:LOW QUALITY PROTEIN: spidroin-2-like n=1 Tax=Mustela erminea TaxID=36723 RepID=UPI001386775A|nr:LOW QUALITY PROTEIN: spidroin-2-like [Mustela erminea]